MSDTVDDTRAVGIIGAGPGGLAAGQYAGLNNVVPVILEKESIGGELVNRDELRGIPGYPDGVSGTDLRKNLVQALDRYEGEIILDEVESVSPGEPHTIVTEGGEFDCDAIVIATGGRPEELGVPGEDEYEGRGVFHCAKCDGPLFDEERVAVAGGNNHSIIDAIFLTRWASEVTVIEPSDDVPADDHLLDEAESAPNLTVQTDTDVVSINGNEGVLSSITTRDLRDGSESTRQISGLYIHTGIQPNSEFLEGTVSMDDHGRIKVGPDMETTVEGIYAIGDVRQNSPHEIASAFGDGFTAMNAIAKHHLDSA